MYSKTVVQGLILFGILAVIGGCSSGIKSKHLSTSTALEIIKKHPTVIPSEVVAYFEIPGDWYIHHPGSENEKRDVAFINSLVDAGLLYPPQERVHQINQDVGPPLVVDEYIITPVRGSDVNIFSPGPWQQIRFILAVSDPQDIKVRRVLQEGVYATAYIEVGTKVTPIYSRIERAVSSQLSYCRTPNANPPIFCEPYTAQLPPEPSLSATITKGERHFARFSDGWRLVDPDS